MLTTTTTTTPNAGGGGDTIKVAVRVRPMNTREKDLNSVCAVEMSKNQIILHNLSQNQRQASNGIAGVRPTTTRQQPIISANRKSSSPAVNIQHTPKFFTFDHCFWSSDNSMTDSQQQILQCSQHDVYQQVGRGMLDNAFQGYNASMFAYGQTGSGKSFTMMGNTDDGGCAENAGIIPRLCAELFARIEAATATQAAVTYNVEVSYMEIYNERVYDLLHPSGTRESLRVREHSALGTYVDGLSQIPVQSCSQIQELMIEGNKTRTIAATNMNAESSRSHAVFSIVLTQTTLAQTSEDSLLNSGGGSVGEDQPATSRGEKVSKICLVDLAGSERAAKTGASGERLKEGGNINKSLTTLGVVISTLADIAAGQKTSTFVPYRDSVLTWILKDSLGGNSKTVMLATVSPSSDNYEETLSTLRYADRAKRIVNHAVVNEDPNTKIIRQLQDEIEALKHELMESRTQTEVVERLEESEKLMRHVGLTWHERRQVAEQINVERQRVLEKLGVSVQDSGIKVAQNRFFLVNLNIDPCLNENLVYYLPVVDEDEQADYSTVVGRVDSDASIQLSGFGIEEHHAVFSIEKDSGNCELEEKHNFLLHLTPISGARTCINGKQIFEKTLVRHLDRLLFGENHFFRVNCPQSASSATVPQLLSDIVTTPMSSKTTTSSQSNEIIDYEYAREEVVRNDQQTALLTALEHKFEQDKQVALQQQREHFQQELSKIMSQVAMTPATTPLTPSLYAFANNNHNINHLTGTSSPMLYDLPPSVPLQTRDLLIYLTSSTSNPNFLSTLGGAIAYGGHSFEQLEQQQKARAEFEREREQAYRRCLTQLKSEVVEVHALVREANYYAAQLQNNNLSTSPHVEFDVTLRIPARNLSPNYRNLGGPLVEAAVLVKQQCDNNPSANAGPPQVWSVEKLKSRLVDMRDLYDDQQQQHLQHALSHKPTSKNPFYSADDNFVLIGIANLYLVPLFQRHVAFKCRVPIISQHGEVCGRLDVEISLKHGEISLQDDDEGDAAAENGEKSLNNEYDLRHGGTDDDDSDYDEQRAENDRLRNKHQKSSKVVIQFSLLRAENLPSQFSNYVFCQYIFWDEEQPTMATMRTKLPAVNGSSRTSRGVAFIFGHTKRFAVQVDDDFLEHCLEGALSIEVWGYRAAADATKSVALTNTENSTTLSENAVLPHVGKKTCTITDQWKSVSRKVELWAEILELNASGQYEPVSVTAANSQVQTGGVYRLRQGQQRLIRMHVKPAADNNSGFLPLNFQTIVAAAVGGLASRKRSPDSVSDLTALDSYQDDDLQTLRLKWANLLAKRKVYLDSQLKAISSKSSPSTSTDLVREQALLSQWINLQDELNVLENPEFSDIPGAPPSWQLPGGPASIGMETHIPVLFMNLDTTATKPPPEANSGASTDAVGADSFIETELDSLMLQLPLVRHSEGDYCSATFSWDSTLQESGLLNCVTSNDEYVYMIVKCIVRLTHPVCTTMHLRKRICLQIVRSSNGVVNDGQNSFSSLASSTAKSASAGFTKLFSFPFSFTSPKSVEAPDITQNGVSRAVTAQKSSASHLPLCSTGVTYDVVACIPRDLQEFEDRESLAYLAASGLSPPAEEQPVVKAVGNQSTTLSSLTDANQENNLADAQDFVDKYVRTALDVDELLRVEQLRQHLFMKELLLKYMTTNKTSSKAHQQNNSGIAYRSSPKLAPDSKSIMGSTLSLCTNGQQLQNSFLHNSVWNLSQTLGSKTDNITASSNDALPFVGEKASWLSVQKLVENEDDSGQPRANRLASARPSSLNVPSIIATSNTLNDKTEQHLSSALTSNAAHDQIANDNDLLNTIDHDSSTDNSWRASTSTLSDTNSSAATTHSGSTTPATRAAAVGFPNWIRVGIKCRVLRAPTSGQQMSPKDKTTTKNADEGVVRFVGPTKFATGIWVGVEILSEAVEKASSGRGRHDGAVNDVRYFTCSSNCGVFVRPNRLMPFSSSAPRKPSIRTSRTSVDIHINSGENGSNAANGHR